MTETELLYNPFLPGFTDDPYPHYRRMRDADPVHEHPLGFWFVSRYDDVVGAAAGRAVGGGPQPRRRPGRRPVPGSWRGQRGALDLSMLDRDPPDHTRLRKLVTKVFTPRAIAALEPMVTGLVDAALDRIADGGQVDLIEELAFPLPFAVISEMLGTPPTDHVRLRELPARWCARWRWSPTPSCSARSRRPRSSCRR